MTIYETRTVPPHAAPLPPVASAEHLGASPRPKRYHGRHRRSRNAG